MAGTITEIPTNGAADWTDSKTIEFEIIGKGMMKLSLTNMDDDSEPQIEAGSVIEMDGSFCRFNTIESITGWAGIANETDVYIKLTASGSSVSASFTTSAPSWSASKQGYYDGSDRYIGGLYKDASANYTRKYLYIGKYGQVGIIDRGADVKYAVIDGLALSVTQDAIGTNTIEFNIYVTTTAYIKTVVTNYANAVVSLQYYQNADYQEIETDSIVGDPDLTGYLYGLVLAPGQYRISNTTAYSGAGTNTAYLYLTSLFQDGVTAEDIVKEL